MNLYFIIYKRYVFGKIRLFFCVFFLNRVEIGLFVWYGFVRMICENIGCILVVYRKFVIWMEVGVKGEVGFSGRC